MINWEDIQGKALSGELTVEQVKALVYLAEMRVDSSGWPDTDYCPECMSTYRHISACPIGVLERMGENDDRTSR